MTDLVPALTEILVVPVGVDDPLAEIQQPLESPAFGGDDLPAGDFPEPQVIPGLTIGDDLPQERVSALAFRDTETGVVAIWRVPGALAGDNPADGFLSISLNSEIFRGVSTSSDSNWVVAGIGRYTNSTPTTHSGDILWRNTATGQNVIWLTSGANTVGTQVLQSVTGIDWEILSTSDMDSDDHSDILWWNDVTDTAIAWYMDNGAIREKVVLDIPGGLTSSQTIAGAGDFNGDDKADVFVRDESTGENGIYFGQYDGQLGLKLEQVQATELGHELGATTDLNRDDKTDLVWQGPTGSIEYWLMDGTSVIQSGSINSSRLGAIDTALVG